MKPRRLFMLFALLVCLFVSSPAQAIVSALPGFDLIIDPGIFTPVIPVFDPCFGAKIVTEMTYPPVPYDAQFDIGGSYYTAVYAYDLSMSGEVVAHVISTYKRIGTGTSAMVAMDDTFDDVADNLTLFGHSVNRGTTGVIGLQGVFIGAVTYDGVRDGSLNGSYITTNQGGTNRLCAFMDW